MLASQKLAIAAHLHVLLRRKTGRVTDTEWMAVNPEYAREIVRFARAKAIEDGHPDLAEWADKLELAAQDKAPAPRPIAESALNLLRQRPAAPLAPAGSATPAAPTAPAEHPGSGFGHSASPESGFAESTLGTPRKPRDPNAPRYVGGIR